MSGSTAPALWPPNVSDGLPALFVRLGWLGVWIQLVIIAGDVAFTGYVVLTSEAAGRGIGLRAALVVAGLAVMLFTTFWFYRYARLGRRMADPHRFPEYATVVATLWTGAWASGVGILLSLLLLFASAGRMLLILLAAPQAGAAVAVGAREGSFLSAFDGVSLMGSLVVLTVEMLLLALSLWLLFRTSRHTRSLP